jgi:hypothetical protein
LVEEQPDGDGVDPMQLELEGRRDAEIAAVARDRPEQSLSVLLARTGVPSAVTRSAEIRLSTDSP